LIDVVFVKKTASIKHHQHQIRIITLDFCECHRLIRKLRLWLEWNEVSELMRTRRELYLCLSRWWWDSARQHLMPLMILRFIMAFRSWSEMKLF